MIRFLIVGGAVVVAIVGWVLISPLFIDDVVEEDFPIAQATSTPAAQSDSVAPDADADLEDVAMEDAMPSGAPVALLRGTFRDADQIHQGSGDAAIYRLADGSHVLRFENFRATNGPDLFVWLTTADAPQNSSDVTNAEWLSLGALKGNVGNQNYEIPADVDIASFNNVVIWCRAFSVLFAAADFEAAE